MTGLHQDFPKVIQRLECKNARMHFFAILYLHVNCRVLLMTGPEWAKSRSDFLSILNHPLSNINVIWSFFPRFLAMFPIFLSVANQMLENMDFTQGMCHHFHPKFKSVILLSELLISFKISSENLRVCQYLQFKCSCSSVLVTCHFYDTDVLIILRKIYPTLFSCWLLADYKGSD